MNKLVKIESSSAGVAKVEQYPDDISEHNIINPPNFESMPLETDQALLVDTDKRGESAIVGVSLSTGIEPGEVRIPWTDSSGVTKGYLYLTKDGKVIINNGTAELIDLLVQTLEALESATVATALGPQPLSTAAVITAIKNNLITFRG